jgi:hypothetical protein
MSLRPLPVPEGYYTRGDNVPSSSTYSIHPGNHPPCPNPMFGQVQRVSSVVQQPIQQSCSYPTPSAPPPTLRGQVPLSTPQASALSDPSQKPKGVNERELRAAGVSQKEIDRLMGRPINGNEQPKKLLGSPQV